MRPALRSGTYAPITCAMSTRSLTTSKSPGIGENLLPVPLGADEEERPEGQERREKQRDDREIDARRMQHGVGGLGPPRIEDVAREVDGVAQRREVRDRVEPRRQSLQRVEHARQEVLRQQREAEDLRRHPAVREPAQDEQPEG